MGGDLKAKIRAYEVGDDSLGECVSVGTQPPFMISFSRKVGNRISLGSHLLHAVEFNPSEGLSFDFGTYKVDVTGERLEPVFEAASEQRLLGLREGNDRLEKPASDMPFVRTILWEKTV